MQTAHKNLFVVGDPDQTIYSWRGADIASILNFDTIYKSTKTIMLTKNYRSSSEILHVSNELIKHNKNRIEKELISTRGNIANVSYIHSINRNEENEFVVNKILKEHSKGVNYNDIAIIYRANRLSKEIEEKLIAKSIPYRVYNGIEFYSRKEIKDSLAFLKLIAYGDDLSFERVINNPHKKFGPKRMSYLKSLSSKYNSSLYETLKNNLSDPLFNIQEIKNFIYLIENIKSNLTKYEKISDLLNYLLEASGYLEYLKVENDEDRLENIKELQVSIKKIDDTEEITLDEYLTQITLISNVDKETNNLSILLL